ncbi:aminodeoxychorismate lyase [Ferrimonas pelagia]|uniref:Aminodeoxychorismate lyase n=1 Tax=Ferrimonas pelagia TaxID=1177826 RepID=A0ABP9F9Y0_9GAMM
MAIWVDGQRQHTVAADDRGLTLADGHFTTMLVRHGAVVLWPLHQARLAQACERLFLAEPDWAELEREIHHAVHDQALACLRLTLTRGSAGRGYAGQCWATPRRILSLNAFPSLYARQQQTGVALAVARIRLAVGGPLVGLKTLGRTEQVLLKQECAQRSVDDLVVLDQHGAVIEACAGNLFMVLADRIVTPPLHSAGVAGVMRQHLLILLPQLGYRVVIEPISVGQLAACEELFISNCLMGVLPVRCLNGQALPSMATTQHIINAGALWR